MRIFPREVAIPLFLPYTHSHIPFDVCNIVIVYIFLHILAYCCQSHTLVKPLFVNIWDITIKLRIKFIIYWVFVPIVHTFFCIFLAPFIKLESLVFSFYFIRQFQQLFRRHWFQFQIIHSTDCCTVLLYQKYIIL